MWSRNPAAGIAAPVVLGLVMQLVGALGGVEAVRPFLLTTATRPGTGCSPSRASPARWSTSLVVSAVWGVVSLTAAATLLRRRDVTGG